MNYTLRARLGDGWMKAELRDTIEADANQIANAFRGLGYEVTLDPEAQVCQCWNEGQYGRVHREDCPLHRGQS